MGKSIVMVLVALVNFQNVWSMDWLPDDVNRKSNSEAAGRRGYQTAAENIRTQFADVERQQSDFINRYMALRSPGDTSQIVMLYARWESPLKNNTFNEINNNLREVIEHDLEMMSGDPKLPVQVSSMRLQFPYQGMCVTMDAPYIARLKN